MFYYRIGIRQPVWPILSVPIQFLSLIFLTSTCSVEHNLAPLLGHPSHFYLIAFRTHMDIPLAFLSLWFDMSQCPFSTYSHFSFDMLLRGSVYYKTLQTTLEQSSFCTSQFRAHSHSSQPLKLSSPTFTNSFSSLFSLIHVRTRLLTHISRLPTYIVRVLCGS